VTRRESAVRNVTEELLKANQIIGKLQVVRRGKSVVPWFSWFLEINAERRPIAN
jgi:hypothetical protein